MLAGDGGEASESPVRVFPAGAARALRGGRLARRFTGMGGGMCDPQAFEGEGDVAGGAELRCG